MFHYKDENIVDYLTVGLEKMVPNDKEEIVIVCVGSDRVTGDSLGPFVGQLLKKHSIYKIIKNKVHIYGTLNEPVTARNLEQVVEEINGKHFSPFIIAIDASLSKTKAFGELQIIDLPLSPGAGIGKALPKVGDIRIIGIVGYLDENAIDTLKTVSLGPVYEMAEIISTAIMNYAKNNHLTKISGV